MERDTVDLLQLLGTLREGLMDLFPSSVWVKAEISSVSVKGGHCYMTLCQQEDGRTVASADSVIWRSRYLPLSAYFREATGGDLRPGLEVLVRARVNYSEIYGLKLVIDEIEPQFTLGAAELQKRRTIEMLTAEGLIDRQKGLEPSELPYRLAVVSAAGAAGYGDFMRHLGENPYGFVFQADLFEATMQGEKAPGSICAAIEAVQCARPAYDAVLIMRGGGSALDLACFDDYALCFTIATCPIPVYTAIGHDRDYHVSDMVAYDFVKTPTALADLFIDAFAAEDERISSFGTRLRLAFSSKISELEAKLDMIGGRIKAADPRNILSRGYTLVADGRGVVLKSASGLAAGQRLRILFADGEIKAVVEK